MSEYRLVFSAALVTAGCLMLSACGGTPAPGGADGRLRTALAGCPSVEEDGRIVTRVGVCVTDLGATGAEPCPGVSETPVLRRIQRLRAAQGL
ncbi:hypothetical protein [Streptomyces yangpuensis]|uniref:hypothetical protein n=1 Tax=Streptomyces yangpuensis TaxID=1648182 RepID=UPI003665AA83